MLTYLLNFQASFIIRVLWSPGQNLIFYLAAVETVLEQKKEITEGGGMERNHEAKKLEDLGFKYFTGNWTQVLWVSSHGY